MGTKLKSITKKYALDADRKNLHFAIPTGGEISFLFLSSKTAQMIAFDQFPVNADTVDMALDSFIADTLLLSATLSDMPIFGLEDIDEREARIEEWKQEIPETIEICHRAVMEYIETKNLQ